MNKMDKPTLLVKSSLAVFVSYCTFISMRRLPPVKLFVLLQTYYNVGDSH